MPGKDHVLSEQSAAANHLLLIGGGHAHLAVLADMIERGSAFDHVTLLTPSEHLQYSGMVPGWIAGRYGPAEGLVDVAALAQRAGAELILAKCTAIDADARRVQTDGGQSIAFDIASIDTGGIGRGKKVLGDHPSLIDVRPIGAFVKELSTRLAQESAPVKVAVVGGGAAGFEIAFAVRNAAEIAPAPEVSIVLGQDGALPGFAPKLARLAMKTLSEQNIAHFNGNAGFADGALMAGGRPIGDFDLVICAIGSGAPDWPADGGLACDHAGFIAVDAHQRSISHPHIFAVGDVAARQDLTLPHSGVHAVFAGPVLAQNLRAVAEARTPANTYRPRASSLYLIATGDGGAIASYGRFCARGRWAGRLKHWIDNRWISKYAKLARGD